MQHPAAAKWTPPRSAKWRPSSAASIAALCCVLCPHPFVLLSATCSSCVVRAPPLAVLSPTRLLALHDPLPTPCRVVCHPPSPACTRILSSRSPPPNLAALSATTLLPLSLLQLPPRSLPTHRLPLPIAGYPQYPQSSLLPLLATASLSSIAAIVYCSHCTYMPTNVTHRRRRCHRCLYLIVASAVCSRLFLPLLPWHSLVVVHHCRHQAPPPPSNTPNQRRR
jgi:hypothetical protein